MKSLATVTHRFPRIVGLILGMTVLVWALPPGANAASPFTMDVYYSGGYERQVDSRTCTAAATAMMLNFIARRDLRLNQLDILKYEQRRDALNDATQRGSDPLGWSKALTYYGPRTGMTFTYAWETYATERAALKRAATLIAATGKPVGLAIWNGRHAVVMTGFQATRDPRQGDFDLTYVWISDPYGTAHTRYTTAGSPLDKYLELDATPTYDAAWYGKFVIVAPRDPKPALPAEAAAIATPVPDGTVIVQR